MKIKTKLLQEILKNLQPGISQRKYIEQAAHYIFTGKRICTYNDKISISYPFPSGFRCSVSSKEFYEVVSKLSVEEINLDFINNELCLSSTKVKSGFTSLQEGEIFNLLDSVLVKGNWLPLPKDFVKGISLCLFSTSRDFTQKFLSSICVRGNTVESSDDLRISSYCMEDTISKPFLLPFNSAKELVSYDISDYSIEDSWVHFKLSSGGIFTSRVILEEYPETKQFLDVEGISLELPHNLLNCIEIVSTLSEGDYDLDKKIEVVLEENHILCKGSNSSGWIEKKIPFSYNGEKVSFFINPLFFKQILEKTTKMTLDEGKALFSSGSFLHVMALQI